MAFLLFEKTESFNTKETKEELIELFNSDKQFIEVTKININQFDINFLDAEEKITTEKIAVNKNKVVQIL